MEERRMRTAKQTRQNHLLVTVLGLCLLAAPAAVMSQDVATGSATATVQTALAVSADNNLIFPALFQGVADSMANTNDDSTAQFSITGQGSAGINLQLTLPEYMALADGSDRMTISFRSTDAAVDTLVSTPATMVAGNGWIDQNPYNLPAAAVVGIGGQTSVYLGGKVTPSRLQTAGAYTADIILTVAYTGS